MTELDLDPRRVAYHEAGHAVVALHEGMTVTEVWVDLAAVKESLAADDRHYQEWGVRRPSSGLAAGKCLVAVPAEISQAWQRRRYLDPDWARSAIRHAFGGRAGEAVFERDYAATDDPPAAHFDNDEYEARQTATDAGLLHSGGEAVLDELRADARRIVDTHEAAVHAIAVAVLERTTLPGAEAMAIAAAACPHLAAPTSPSER